MAQNPKLLTCRFIYLILFTKYLMCYLILQILVCLSMWTHRNDDLCSVKWENYTLYFGSSWAIWKVDLDFVCFPSPKYLCAVVQYLKPVISYISYIFPLLFLMGGYLIRHFTFAFPPSLASFCFVVVVLGNSRWFSMTFLVIVSYGLDRDLYLIENFK